MNSIGTGVYLNVLVGSLVRWAHPEAIANGIIIAVKEDGHSAHIRWFDHQGHGFYPLDHKLLKLVSK